MFSFPLHSYPFAPRYSSCLHFSPTYQDSNHKNVDAAAANDGGEEYLEVRARQFLTSKTRHDVHMDET